MNIIKSTRHSKITGDFAEALVLYWLSRDAFECARVDHTGIDLIARNRYTKELMGISVKSRSRVQGQENSVINLPTGNFVKARTACVNFGCQPWYAIVVDVGDVIRGYLVSLEHLEKIVGPGDGVETRYWKMTSGQQALYEKDPEIKRFELRVQTTSWWGTSANKMSAEI
jgi:hypothetical protein